MTSATSLDISAMPGHTAAAVQVRVVSLGIAGTGSYTYNAGPALLFPPPPSGEAGVAYSVQLTVTGGTSPFTWSVSAGSLPAGVTLNASTGLLAGTPTTAGTYPFTVQVTDQSGLSSTEAVSLLIIAGPSLNFPAPPAGWTNTVYSDTLTVTGGTGPFAWTVSSGSLPAGISLSADGNLTGTPTTTGSYPFTVNVIDKNNGIATTAITLVVGAGLTLTFGTPPSGQVGAAYSDTLTAAGGIAPYTWSVSAGTLPAGITLNAATGVLAGTPTAGGTANFTIKATDAAGQTATHVTSITILAGALTIAASANVATTNPGGTVSYTITATNSGQIALTGATFTDPLGDVLDDANYNGNASATAGTVSFTSPNLTWTGNLAVGATATVTFSVTVNNPDTGDKVITTAITSSTTGSSCLPGGSVAGNTSATWNPLIVVQVPGTAIGGLYTATITHSVS